MKQVQKNTQPRRNHRSLAACQAHALHLTSWRNANPDRDAISNQAGNECEQRQHMHSRSAICLNPGPSFSAISWWITNLLIASDVQDDLLIIVSFPAKRSMKQHSIIQKALPGRLELPTLRLTASRSDQLSYGSSPATILKPSAPSKPRVVTKSFALGRQCCVQQCNGCSNGGVVHLGPAVVMLPKMQRSQMITSGENKKGYLIR